MPDIPGASSAPSPRSCCPGFAPCCDGTAGAAVAALPNSCAINLPGINHPPGLICSWWPLAAMGNKPLARSSAGLWAKETVTNWEEVLNGAGEALAEHNGFLTASAQHLVPITTWSRVPIAVLCLCCCPTHVPIATPFCVPIPALSRVPTATLFCIPIPHPRHWDVSSCCARSAQAVAEGGGMGWGCGGHPAPPTACLEPYWGSPQQSLAAGAPGTAPPALSHWWHRALLAWMEPLRIGGG